jgi:alkylation response protein AidB-like acyl-CoA dehydrogenase
MKFSFTEEQEEFRSVLRRFLSDKSPTKEVRRLMATPDGWERDQWAKINTELGLTAVAIPESYGGHGFGLSEQCIMMEEMGRSLLCAPYFGSAVLAANAILYSGTEEQKKMLLPGIASGATIATLAFTEENGLWDNNGIETEFQLDVNEYSLSGTKSFVLDGNTADLIIVLARQKSTESDNGLSFFIVEGKAEGITKELLKTADETRKLTKIKFDNVPAKLLGIEGEAAEPMKKTFTKSVICLANEMVGGAERVREDALEYVKMRMQFGRSIASFQVIKHKATDMLADVELAKSAAYFAAAAFDEEDKETEEAASIAKAAASEAYMQTAIQSIQMHGGVGFTWDNDTHLWFKRAKSSEVFLGTSNYHREIMMTIWDI